MRALAFCCFLTITSQIEAQGLPQVDLGLTVEVIPPFPVPAGSNFIIRWHVKNNSLFSPAIGEIFSLPPIPPNDPNADSFGLIGLPSCGSCLFGDGFCIRTNVIPPNQSATCEALYVAGRYSGIPARARNRVFNSPNSAEDPNPANDTVLYEFSILPPTSTQLPFSPLTYALMSLLIVGSGALAVRRWA